MRRGGRPSGDSQKCSSVNRIATRKRREDSVVRPKSQERGTLRGGGGLSEECERDTTAKMFCYSTEPWDSAAGGSQYNEKGWAKNSFKFSSIQLEWGSQSGHHQLKQLSSNGGKAEKRRKKTKSGANRPLVEELKDSLILGGS